MGATVGGRGMQVIGELTAGTEIPMLTMPNGQIVPNLTALAGGAGISGANTGAFSGMTGQPTRGFPQMGGNGFAGQQTTDGFPQSFPQRSSEEEERLRQQLVAFTRLLDDWTQFTDETWRPVRYSQLVCKPFSASCG